MTKQAQVRLYTRPGCHLCEEMLREMRAAGCADDYQLEEINIDEDPVLKRRYGLKIPVLTIDCREAFKYRLTAAEFRQHILLANRD